MKQIKDIIEESSEWNPMLKSHKKAYDDFCKWYMKHSKYLNEDEILDLLNTAIYEIKNGTLGSID